MTEKKTALKKLQIALARGSSSVAAIFLAWCDFRVMPEEYYPDEHWDQCGTKIIVAVVVCGVLGRKVDRMKHAYTWHNAQVSRAASREWK